MSLKNKKEKQQKYNFSLFSIEMMKLYIQEL